MTNIYGASPSHIPIVQRVLEEVKLDSAQAQLTDNPYQFRKADGMSEMIPLNDSDTADLQLNPIRDNKGDYANTENDEASAENLKDLGQIEDVRLDEICTDRGTQVRAKLNEKTVEEYKELWQSGVQLPPVVVFRQEGQYWLADGWHRFEAARRANLIVIAARVHSGNQRAAILYACGANADHGLRRTNADKRRAVTILLRDKEWRKISDQQIAKICAVSQPFASKIRDEIGAYSDIRTTANGRTMNKTRISEANHQRRHPGHSIDREQLHREISAWIDTPQAESFPVVKDFLLRCLAHESKARTSRA